MKEMIYEMLTELEKTEVFNFKTTDKERKEIIEIFFKEGFNEDIISDKCEEDW